MNSGKHLSRFIHDLNRHWNLCNCLKTKYVQYKSKYITKNRNFAYADYHETLTKSINLMPAISK